MKNIRTNLPPGLIALLVLLAVVFAFIVIPVLLIAGICWLVFSALTGRALSLSDLLRDGRERRRGRIFEGPSEQEDNRNHAESASNDDTIECEVISARTFDEDGREIR